MKWILPILLLAGCATPALPPAIQQQPSSQPVWQAKDQDVTVSFYRERCRLGAVSNLPHRATWTEAGKVFDGCFQIYPRYQVAIAFFSDGAIAVVPLGSLEQVHGL